MKRTLILLVLAALPLCAGAYNDHRGHNLDSLERVVGKLTPQDIDNASDEELVIIDNAYRNLMLGYTHINMEKGLFYGRKALEIARRKGWPAATFDAARYIGMNFYGHEQYDSAMVYYSEALSCLERMENGATSITSPDGYSENELDDARSSMYGTIGNLYNMMDSIPLAMEYYKKAGEIFEKHGWKESCSLLHYNMGETWMESYDYDKALLEYKEALRFGQEAGDSLCVANASMGLGRWYMEKGRPRKAMRYLRKADEYYSVHPDQEFRDLIENSGYTAQVLKAQKRQITWIAIGLAVLVAGLATFLVLLRRRRKAAASPAPAAVKLTARELEILRFIADGKTNTQIAEALFLSPETTKWYRKQLFAKFDAENAADLVRKAMEQKVL